MLENAPAWSPWPPCCEANGQNYSADYSALMAAVDAEKNRMLPGRADYAAPFARGTAQRTSPSSAACPLRAASGS